MSTCLVIHGTWGDQSDFAFSDSLFCRAIKTATQHTLEFERFEWSGKNSSAERAQAALRLREAINSFPDSRLPIFLLAHSHGGNVAIEALRDECVARRVAGVVTMGTPFLSETIRHWVLYLSTMPGRMSVYAVVVGIVLASVFAIVGSIISMHHPAYGFAGLLALVVLFFVSGRSSHSDLLEGAANAVRLRSEKILAKNSSPLNAKLLVVHARADEALWWLRHVFAVSTIPFALFSFGLVTTGWAMMLAIALGTLFRVLRLFVDEESIEWMIVPVFAAAGMGLSALLLGMVAILLTKSLQRFIGTGEAVSLWSDIVTRVQATRLPKITVTEMSQLNASLGRFHGGLSHSKYMRSGDVADHIGQVFNRWQSNRAA